MSTILTQAEAEALENAKALEAHRRALHLAQAAAEFWTNTAADLTDLRAHGGQKVPGTDTEEWFDPRRPQIPFDLEELDAELMALSGLITKAYTLTAIYRGQIELLVEAIQDIEDRQ